MVAQKQKNVHREKKLKHRLECSTVTIIAQINSTTLCSFSYYTSKCVHSTQLTHKIYCSVFFTNGPFWTSRVFLDTQQSLMLGSCVNAECLRLCSGSP